MRLTKQDEERKLSPSAQPGLSQHTLYAASFPQLTESIQSPTQYGCDLTTNRKYLGYLAENLGLHHLAQEAGSALLREMLLAEFLVSLKSE